MSCDDAMPTAILLFPVVTVTCLLTMTKHPTVAIYRLSFRDHFHCDHNSRVSVFIWGFTMAHTLRVQSVMTQEPVVAVHTTPAAGKEGDEFWCSARFLRLIQSEPPALGAPTFSVGLPASITPV